MYSTLHEVVCTSSDVTRSSVDLSTLSPSLIHYSITIPKSIRPRGLVLLTWLEDVVYSYSGWLLLSMTMDTVVVISMPLLSVGHSVLYTMHVELYRTKPLR